MAPNGHPLMVTETPAAALSLIVGGAQVVVRDEEWLVRSVQRTPSDGLKVRCIGRSPLVRDTEATFFTKLEVIEPLRPEDTRFVDDTSPNFRGSRLFLEAVIRKTPVAATDSDLAVVGGQLLNTLQYQRRAVRKALGGLRPRVLIADSVGLGKTLEVGMLLSELIRRGRGERILVVTPRHILEQFQHELWTRFAIPLVRLDSEGIQRVRQKIPANRNPFTFYKRAIISIDTLKNAGRYRHHLEAIQWDAVVIDECHSLVNAGTLNNQLANVLAPPHRRVDPDLGHSAQRRPAQLRPRLIRLLDPTAIADPDQIQSRQIEHLYIRRHKAHEEVAREVGHDWADRLPPTVVPVDPNPAEAELFGELSDTWVHPISAGSPSSGQGASLFPWTLLKAALSSHRALRETANTRRRNLTDANGEPTSADRANEVAALTRLVELADQVEASGDTPAKLDALVRQLQQIGLGPSSATRVVVFSERIATLDWLAAEVPRRLGLKPEQVRVLHGGMADVKQMDVIAEFGLGDSSVRLLLTGDMASEGVNLHRECHHLIHFDLAWSLITTEQRNGRIDRYGQEHSPDIRALAVTPDHERLTGDVRILSKLLQREHSAHLAFGESGSLLGLHTAAAEEEAIMKALRDGVDPDDAIPTEPVKEFDLLAILAGGTGLEPVPDRRPPSLFDSDFEFVSEALHTALEPDEIDALDVRRDDSDPTYLNLVPPADLRKRLDDLPQSYLTEQRVAERLRLTADPLVAETMLARARQSTASNWPEVGHLSPLHPLVDWLVDKVLVMVDRNQAPVLRAAVDAPTFCVQGVWSNGRGQPQLVEWMAISRSGERFETADLFTTLELAGVGPAMPNPGTVSDLPALESELPAVVDTALAELTTRRATHDARVDELLSEPTRRLDEWAREANSVAFRKPEPQRRREERHVGEVKASTRQLIDDLRTTGEPLVRVLAVIVPVVR